MDFPQAIQRLNPRTSLRRKAAERPDPVMLSASSIREDWRRFYVSTSVAAALLALIFFLGECLGYGRPHAVASALIITCYVISIFFSAPVFLFLALPFLAVVLPVALSNSYLEFGPWMSEQGRYAEVTGGTTRFSLYVLIFIVAASVPVFLRSRKVGLAAVAPPLKVSVYARWAIRCHLAVLALVAGVVVVFGSPLLMGQDRFAYWALLPGGLNRIPTLMVMSFVVLCIGFVYDLPSPSARRILSPLRFTGLVGVTVLELVLLGEKFTALFAMLTYGVGATFAATCLILGVKPPLLRLALAGLGAMALLLALAGYGYMRFYGYEFNTVGPKILDRALGQQGHVWFGIDRNAQQDAERGSMFQFFSKTTLERPTGIDALMYQVAPQDFVDRMRSKGNRFTMGSPAIALYTLGYVGAIGYQIFGGLLSGLLFTYYRFSILHPNVFRILAVMAGFRIITNVFAMGEVSDIYGPVAIGTIAFIMGDLLLRYRRRRGQKPLDHAIGIGTTTTSPGAVTQ